MRDNIKSFISFCSNKLKIEGIVLEVGSYQVKGQEGYADLRPLFKNNFFVGVDIRIGPGVDTLHDIHNLGFKNNCASWVLCLDTLEHVKNPLEAVAELKRVMKKKGIIILSSVMDFPIHEHPWDFWRFTPQIFDEMFSDLKYKLILYQGEHLKPHTIIGLGSNSIDLDSLNLPKMLNKEKLFVYNKSKKYEYNLEDTLDYKFNKLSENFNELKKNHDLLQKKYDSLLKKNKELQEQINQIYMSISWKVIKKYRQIIDYIFPENKKLRRFYNYIINLFKK